MKNLIALIFLLYSFTIAFSQSKNDSLQKNKFDIITIHQNPDFPGGNEALNKFIFSNVKYPPCDTIGGKNILSFVVDTKG